MTLYIALTASFIFMLLAYRNGAKAEYELSLPPSLFNQTAAFCYTIMVILYVTMAVISAISGILLSPIH